MTRREVGWEDRARSLYGWRAEAAAHPCPTYVAGRGCTRGTDEEPCLCEGHEPLLDHPRVWHTGTERIYTAEPASVIEPGELAALRERLRAHGLRVTLLPGAGEHHGSTYLLAITKAASQ